MSTPITLSGRLTADPEIKIANSGTTIARFTVVTSRRVKKGEEWTDEGTSFWNCTAFGQLAQNIGDSLTKGTAVLVVGRAEQENWQDREGNKRTAIKVIADEAAPSLKFATAKVVKADRSNGNGGGTGGNSGGNRPAPARQGAGSQQGDPWATGGGAGGWGGGYSDQPPF